MKELKVLLGHPLSTRDAAWAFVTSYSGSTAIHLDCGCDQKSEFPNRARAQATTPNRPLSLPTNHNCAPLNSVAGKNARATSRDRERSGTDGKSPDGADPVRRNRQVADRPKIMRKTI